MATSARLPRPIGYLMGLSGLAYLPHGWVLGVGGFDAANTVAILSGDVLMLSWIVWLGLVAYQAGQGSTQAVPPGRQRSSAESSPAHDQHPTTPRSSAAREDAPFVSSLIHVS